MPEGYDKVLYSTDGENWSEDIPTGKDAGDYTVSVKYVDSTGNHEEFEGEDVPVTINPAEAPTELADEEKPTANDLTYTGEDQELVTAPEEMPDGYDKVLYSTDGENWSEDIPTGKDAGDYTVSVKYVDSEGNHEEFEGTDIPVTIDPASAPTDLTDDEKPTANDLAYTGEDQALVTAPKEMPDGYDKVLYSADGGETWSEDIPTGKDAGDYTVSVTYVDSEGNHEEFDGEDIPVTIKPATAPTELEDEEKPTANDLAYTGEDQALVTEPEEMPDGYDKVLYSTDGGETWSEDIPTGKDAGDYTVSVKYVDSTGNHEEFEGEDITVTIKPEAAPTELEEEEKPTANDLTYTGEEQPLVTKPESLPDGYDKILYSTDGGETWSEDIPTGKDAGDYTVNVKYVDSTGNHEEFEGEDIPVTIDPAAAPTELADDEKPTANDLTYTGEDQDLVTEPENLPDDYDKVLYSTDGGKTWSEDIPTGKDAGDYTVSVKYVDSTGNHEDLIGDDITVTIDPAAAPTELADDEKPTANDLTYTGEDQDLVTEPENLPDGYDKVLYSTDGGKTWSEEIPTGKDAGDYTVSVKYVDTTGNHKDLIGEDITVTIAASGTASNKAPVTIDGKTEMIEVGQKAEKPADPKKYGYDFVGWFADGKEYDFTAPVGPNGVVINSRWAQIVYTVVEGGGTWEKGSLLDLVFRSVRINMEPTTFSHFVRILVDGKVVDVKFYTARHGSVILNLKAEFLETLEVGEHTLEFVFDDTDDTAKTTFTIVGPKKYPGMPKTGEKSDLYSMIGTLFLAASAAFVIKARKREDT